MTTQPQPTKVTAQAPEKWSRGTIRGTRETITAKLNASALSKAQIAVILEELAKVPADQEFISVCYYAHDPMPNMFSNWSCTITPLN